MENGEQGRTLEVDERLRLIDVSSEDDCLIFSANGNENELDDFRMSDFGNAQEMEYEDTTSIERDGHVLSESLEPERTNKTSKFNLRKSLAWDSAFLDSAGVLDAEELSMINSGVGMAEKHPLPAIQEDVRRSIESNSTLDSDSFSLENLEVDLFADIRASIQRSSKAANFAGSKTRQESGLQNLHSSRKTDLASRNKMKPMLASKRQSINTQGEKTTKEASVRPQAVQATSKSGESSSLSHRPPKISSQANAISVASTKRTSLAPNRAKIESNTAKPGRGKGGPNVVPRKAGVGDSGVTPRSKSPKSSTSSLSVTPRSLSPRSYSSSHSISNIESAASCSPHNRPGSSSSDSTSKSPMKLKNKTFSRDVNQAARPTVKTPPMVASRSNAESINSRLMTYLKSTTKTTSSVSSASSVDGWSSESSSSTSTANHRSTSSNSKKSPDLPRKGFSLERDIIQVSDLQNLQHVQPCVGYERTKSSSQFTKRSPDAGALSHPPSTNASRSSKPSGLRMPSPKIGFFDAEKSVVQTSESGLQFHSGARSGIPKHGTGSIGGTVKAKPGRHQPARIVTGTGSNISDQHLARVPHSAPSVKPTTVAQIRELSNAMPKVSAISRTREKSPGISPKDHASLNTNKGSRPKDGKREVTKMDKDSSLSLSNEVGNGFQKEFKNVVVTESRDMVHMKSLSNTPTKEDISQKSTLPSFGCDTGNVNISKEPDLVSGGEPINGESDFESQLSLIHKSNEKGNENQVDCLSRQMGMIDLSKEEELSCKNSPSLSQDDGSLGTGRADHVMELTKVDSGSLVCFSDEVKNGDQGACISGMITESNELALIKSLKDNPAKEDTSQNSNKASSCDDHDNMNSSKRSDEMPINGENDLDNRINPLCKSNEKENSLSIENQVECLTRHMGTIDLKKDGLSENNSSSFSQCDVDKTNIPADPKLEFLDSKKAFAHGQTDLAEDTSKYDTLSSSSNSVDNVPSPKSPLAAKLTSSNCTGSSGAQSDVS